MAYIEGVASPGVVRHIKACPACASEVTTLRRLDSLLSMSLRVAEPARLAPLPVGRGNRLAAPVKVRRPYSRTGSFWPVLRLPETVWRTASLLVALFVVLTTTTVLYYRFSPTWPARLPVISNYYPDNAEPKTGSMDETSRDSKLAIKRGEGAATWGGIVEHNAAIAPPRNLLRALPDQWSGVIEDTSAIAPPRHLLLELQKEMQPDN